MDKVSTNTYDHRWMTIGTTTDFRRTFQITPGGDGQMSFHIYLALTSFANVIYSVLIDGVSGAPLPMIIHASTTCSPKKV